MHAGHVLLVGHFSLHVIESLVSHQIQQMSLLRMIPHHISQVW